jgi:hypothetical protein
MRKKLFHFAHEKGGWDYVLLTLDEFLRRVKEGKISISALDPNNFTLEEVERIHKEGFNLIVDQHPCIGQILRIERS